MSESTSTSLATIDGSPRTRGEIVSMLQRFDGWTSSVSGIGTAARDRSYDARFVAGLWLSDPELEALYDGNGLARRICDVVPEDALRKPVAVVIAPDGDDDAAARAETTERSSLVTTRLVELGAQKLVTDALVWRRALGGAAVYVNADDGRRPEDPLDETHIRAIRSLRMYTKRELQIRSVYADRRHPKYGQPALYWLSPSTVSGPEAQGLVHESRLVVFDGLRVSPERRAQNGGWGGSVLSAIYDDLRDLGLSWASITQLMHVASQAVYRMQGLIAGVADGERENIEERMQLVELYRSMCRAVLLDAGGPNGEGAEAFELHEVNFSGIAQAAEIVMMRISAVTGLPQVVLFGRAPAGLNATGDSDHQTMEKLVESEQEMSAKPGLERITKLVMLAKDGPTGGVEPDQWGVQFQPLRVMTAKEIAELRKLHAETDRVYIDGGVVLPEEVATSRFRAEGWSPETQIDLDARKEMLEAGRAPGGQEEDETGAPAASVAGKPENVGPEQEEAGTSAADPAAPPVPQEAKDPTTAFNGAQIAEMRETIIAVAEKKLPRATGVQILASAFPLDLAQAERIMGDVGRSFEAPAPPAPPPFGGNAGKPSPPAQETRGGGAAGEDDEEDGAEVAGAGEAPAGSGARRQKRVGARARTDARPRPSLTPPVAMALRLDALDHPHTGAMVALWIPPDVAHRHAVPGGVPPEEMHVTLAYLGEATTVPPSAVEALRIMLRDSARALRIPLAARISGVGTFAPPNEGGEPVQHLLIDAPWLPALREMVVRACRAAGCPANAEHGFTPHATVEYGGVSVEPLATPEPIEFDGLVLALGERRETFLFGRAGT